MGIEWIKMRTNLWDDPRVSRICDRTGCTEAGVIGALYWLWCAADEHTKDGRLDGLSPAALDRKVGMPGFATALIEVGWLEETPRGVGVSRFHEHNGEPTKMRAEDARRKYLKRQDVRETPDKSRTFAGQKVDQEEEVESKDLKTSQPEHQNGAQDILPSPSGPAWGEGLTILIESGLGEKKARAFIGSLLATWDEPAVADALRSAVGKADPVSYARGVLKNKPQKPKLPKDVQKSLDKNLAILRERFPDARLAVDGGAFFVPSRNSRFRLTDLAEVIA